MGRKWNQRTDFEKSAIKTSLVGGLVTSLLSGSGGGFWKILKILTIVSIILFIFHLPSMGVIAVFGLQDWKDGQEEETFVTAMNHWYWWLLSLAVWGGVLGVLVFGIQRENGEK